MIVPFFDIVSKDLLFPISLNHPVELACLIKQDNYAHVIKSLRFHKYRILLFLI